MELSEFVGYPHPETSAWTGHWLPIVPMVPIFLQSVPIVSAADVSVKLYFKHHNDDITENRHHLEPCIVKAVSTR